MIHTSTMGVAGRFCAFAEMPSIDPDIEPMTNIYDAGANKRLGNYNSTMSPLRSWSWDNKVLPRKISNAYTPLIDPSYRGYTWYMFPCGVGVNRLSPSDSFLAGSRDSQVNGGASTGHKNMGGNQIGRVVWGDTTGGAWKTMFWSVPLPEGDMTPQQLTELGGEPQIIVGCWFYVAQEDLGKEVKIYIPVSIKGKPRSGFTRTVKPMIAGWQPILFGFYAQKNRNGANIMDVGLQVSGPAIFTRPFLHTADPSDPLKVEEWRAGEGAYRVLIHSAQRWTQSLNVDRLSLSLVEMSQSFNVR